MKPRKKPVQHERLEQAQGVELLKKIGAKPYVLGTTRAKLCWKCGAPSRDMSTRQTPGIADVIVILPARHYTPLVVAPRPRLLAWEVKSPTGKPSPEQLAFRDEWLDCGGGHVLGTFNALLAYLIEGGWVREDSIAHYRRPNGGAAATVRVPGTENQVGGAPEAGARHAVGVRRPCEGQ